MKKWTFFLISIALGISSFIFPAEHHVDVTPHIGLRHYSRGSGIEVDYRIVGKFEDRSFIVNPRIMGTFARSSHNTLGMGVRHDLGRWVIGTFAFGHHHFFKGYHCFQVGPSIELLSKNWDIRINGTLPVAKPCKIQNNPYLEGELCYKHRYFHVGMGPCVDMMEKSVGVIGRITIPADFGAFNLHLGKDPVHGFVGKISITLFKFSSDGLAHAKPVIRHMRLMSLNRGSPIQITPFNQSVERNISYPELKEIRPMDLEYYPETERKGHRSSEVETPLKPESKQQDSSFFFVPSIWSSSNKSPS